MKAQVFFAHGRSLALACIFFSLAACQVLPPEHVIVSAAGRVSADSPSKAHEVALLLERLQPAVVARLPEARSRSLAVWVQETPALYRYSQRAYQDADGFYSDSEDRIHLREAADSLERTLAHELVHAHLRGAWQELPGTLEEGLCDHVSGELCPDARARLRAGRLSCAAFALGGLSLELAVRVPAELNPSGVEVRLQARLRLEGEPPMDVEPLGVFRRQAGLSSSRLSSSAKKAYYGLAYLVVERIVANIGIEGLHGLCRTAHRAEEGRVPEDVLLAAAGMTKEKDSWRAALVAEYETGDLRELVRMHPEFLVRSLDDFFAPCLAPDELLLALPGLHAELALAGGGATLDLFSVPEVRDRLAGVWLARSPGALAHR